MLALTPTHRDGLLGRTISLSHAGRYGDAISSASRLIDLGGWFIADALYWRAWNRYQLNDMRASRMDIDESKAAAPEPGTLLLSGLIAWRQQELDLAESELSAALTKDFGYCEAALYLGQVRADDRRWPESLAALAHAEQCLTSSIGTREQAIATLSTNPQDNARQIASHQRFIRQAHERRELGREVARRVQQQIARARYHRPSENPHGLEATTSRSSSPHSPFTRQRTTRMLERACFGAHEVVDIGREGHYPVASARAPARAS